ncbi:hydroxyethylthiazole kinase [Arthrobacter echini]|uniref:Hydroxyethylthiazole kinase n=1 Tax=Arthrobacter echini TaxID=1529066 RepID=A0A5D0XV50_9MICC|nr:hydroxyethylthiazole kinase [Arthrobacter echini]TYD00606.1 hydroxyethylthiazole kinase [Arthrobacter echini]
MSAPRSVHAVRFSAAAVGEQLTAMRGHAPLVQCLTNIVVAQWTANVLLAAGASPAMVDNPEESGPFAAVADAVLVNLGTPQEETVAAMHGVVRAAAVAGTPWVLDPVGVGGLLWRTRIASDLLALAAPALIRGNPSEILALSGVGGGGRGPESVDTAEDAVDVAMSLAQQHGTVVAVSGAVDHLTDGTRLVRVANGHPWLTKVTGGGCALGALMAAFAATADDPLLAATAATATYTVAADIAAERVAGPGSFAVALLDSLASLDPQELVDRVVLR